MKRICILLCLFFLFSMAVSAQVLDTLTQQANSDIRAAVGKEVDPSKLGSNTLDRMGKIFAIYKSARELYAGMEALKKNECLPEYTVNPQAMIPSSCTAILDSPSKLEGNSGRAERPPDTLQETEEESARANASNSCVSCYQSAYAKLNSARMRLGRLKCLGQTTKLFVSKKISFGDTVAGIHALTGLAWQKEKKGIEDSYKKFKEAYDAKYRELMDVLVDAMKEIDKCEEKNGQKDWFQRFGFIYVEFMAEKYKRVE